MKLMMYGLPAITLILTSWLPAALQVSFFVSGLLSFFQASLFKAPWFRSSFNMTPLPVAPVAPMPGQGASTTYKGTMNMRAKPIIDAKGVVIPTQPVETQAAEGASRTPLKAKKVLDGAMKDVMRGYEGARKTFSDVAARGKKGVSDRVEKGDRAAAEKYETRRQGEIEQMRLEREQKRRADRATRR